MTNQRLKSLDVFRGLTMAAMILVNNPGSWDAIYPPLEHAQWFGWTPTDLIFPFFLFIVGITTSFSLSSRRKNGSSDATLIKHVLRRGGLLLIVGLLLTGFPYHQFYVSLPFGWVFDSRTAHLDIAHWRLTGVLQRIGICYIAAALLTLRTTIKQQILILVALLYGYWIALTIIPVPGGMALNVPDASLAAWIDRAMIGTNHLWTGSKTWDPEGILSTFPAIVTAMLGTIAGCWLKSDRPIIERVWRLFAAGIIAILLGLLWSLYFPIAKNLWTSSYVLFSAGAAACVLAACLWLIDIEHIDGWTEPFVIYGVNPIVAYVGSSWIARFLYTLIKVPTSGGLVPLETAIFNCAYASWLSPRNASLLFALTCVAGWLVALRILHRRDIIVKL